jgi:glycosyltransferase involved in cell wall biosynthesis
MNICIVAHSYLPDLGGSEETIRRLVKEFSSQPHAVTIIVFTNRKKIEAFNIIDSISVYRIYVPFTILARPGFGGFIDGFALFFRLPFVLRKTAGVLKKIRPHIINVHYVGVNAFCIWILSWFYPFRYLITLHGFNMHVLPFVRGFSGIVYKNLFRLILMRASYVTACSRALLDDAIRRVPAIQRKSKAILNGVDTGEFRLNGPALIAYPYILCLGRMHAPFKGFDLALLALRDILDSGFDVRLVLAGDGPALEEYEEFAELLGIQEKVFFFGKAQRHQVVNLFQHCQFFVMPSRVEPFGIVNLEAMAAGKAIIASRTGGIPEAIEDGVEGLLVEPCNITQLSDAIKRLIYDSPLREELGRNGRHKIDRGIFSWGKSANQYLELYTYLAR